jgi:hypothetical protein
MILTQKNACACKLHVILFDMHYCWAIVKFFSACIDQVIIYAHMIDHFCTRCRCHLVVFKTPPCLAKRNGIRLAFSCISPATGKLWKLSETANFPLCMYIAFQHYPHACDTTSNHEMQVLIGLFAATCILRGISILQR